MQQLLHMIHFMGCHTMPDVLIWKTLRRLLHLSSQFLFSVYFYEIHSESAPTVIHTYIGANYDLFVAMFGDTLCKYTVYRLVYINEVQQLQRSCLNETKSCQNKKNMRIEINLKLMFSVLLYLVWLGIKWKRKSTSQAITNTSK